MSILGDEASGFLTNCMLEKGIVLLLNLIITGNYES